MPTTYAETEANFCANIAYLRRSRGLTQKEMALILGIGIRSLRMLEKGTIPRNLGVQMLIPLARFSGVRIMTLFGERLEETGRG